MKTISVCQLRTNPAGALRDARNEIVVVIDGGEPPVMLIGFAQLGETPDVALVRQAIAVGLFKDHLISLSDAAKLSGEPIGAMLTRLASQGVAVADYDASALANEVRLGAAWIAASVESACHQPNQ